MEASPSRLSLGVVSAEHVINEVTSQPDAITIPTNQYLLAHYYCFLDWIGYLLVRHCRSPDATPRRHQAAGRLCIPSLKLLAHQAAKWVQHRAYLIDYWLTPSAAGTRCSSLAMFVESLVYFHRR